MEIERDIVEELKAWQNAPERKPLLIRGARQIGKTWAIEKFGKQNFKYCAKFDFDRQPELKSVFQTTKEPLRIIKELSLYCEQPIIAGETLLIFDEIQECEEAFNALKYFCEDAPQYHIIAAGSLLGVAVRHRRMTVPVGKVKVIRMYPISFNEFLRASDKQTYDFVNEINSLSHLPEIILNKLLTEYRRYLICGGMPEATVSLLENAGMGELDSVLQDILDLYELDFSKYAEPKEITRIHSVWHSLPSQLSKENRKFRYKLLRSGARSKDYEDALMWLEDAGIIYRIYDITKPALPLSAYARNDAFKVYACDCGLLRRLANLSASVVASPTDNYTEFKGAMAENSVLQTLLPTLNGALPYYWTSEGKAEVEFVCQKEDKVIPVEVKAGNNVDGKSLTVYNQKYSPELRIRFSSLNLQYNGGMLSCPTPMAGWIDHLIALINNKQ